MTEMRMSRRGQTAAYWNTEDHKVNLELDLMTLHLKGTELIDAAGGGYTRLGFLLSARELLADHAWLLVLLLSQSEPDDEVPEGEAHLFWPMLVTMARTDPERMKGAFQRALRQTVEDRLAMEADEADESEDES